MNKFRIKICPLAEKDHKKDQRAYAHWGHYPKTICISQSIYRLPKQVSLALLLHELGHALCDGEYEEEANKTIYNLFKIKIKYAPETPWGKRLQYILSPEVPKVINILKKFISESSLKPFLQ